MGLDFIKSKEFLNEGYRPSEDEPFMNEAQADILGVSYLIGKSLYCQKAKTPSKE